MTSVIQPATDRNLIARACPPMALLLSLCVVIVACGTEPPSEAELLAPPLGASAGGEVDLLEVRAMTITWEGADGASDRVTRSRDEARERANMLSSLLRTPGSNFGEVARSYGDGAPQILRLSAGGENAALFAAASELAIHEVSRPISTPAGFVVLSRRPNPESGPSEVHARHILIAHVEGTRVSDEVTRTRDEAAELAQAVRQQALDGADWMELHAANTDEPGSPPGGDLGTFGRGQMVPAFEQAAFSLEPGAVSEVVETQFGFHIIQRVE